MSVVFTEKDARDINNWYRRRKIWQRRPQVSFKCLVWNHKVTKAWKAERNRQWLLSILRDMESRL